MNWDPNEWALRQRMQQGDTSAAIELAQRMSNDQPEHVQLLQWALARGDYRAAVWLAAKYHRPPGWGGDYREALRYYQILAQAPDAQLRAHALAEIPKVQEAINADWNEFARPHGARAANTGDGGNPARIDALNKLQEMLPK